MKKRLRGEFFRTTDSGLSRVLACLGWRGHGKATVLKATSSGFREQISLCLGNLEQLASFKKV